MASFYSNNYNPISSEDNLVTIEPENYNLHSDGKISTTVDISSTESAKQSKSLLFFFVFNLAMNFQINNTF